MKKTVDSPGSFGLGGEGEREVVVLKRMCEFEKDYKLPIRGWEVAEDPEW